MGPGTSAIGQHRHGVVSRTDVSGVYGRTGRRTAVRARFSLGTRRVQPEHLNLHGADRRCIDRGEPGASQSLSIPVLTIGPVRERHDQSDDRRCRTHQRRHLQAAVHARDGRQRLRARVRLLAVFRLAQQRAQRELRLRLRRAARLHSADAHARIRCHPRRSGRESPFQSDRRLLDRRPLAMEQRIPGLRAGRGSGELGESGCGLLFDRPRCAGRGALQRGR